MSAKAETFFQPITTLKSALKYPFYAIQRPEKKIDQDLETATLP